MTQYGQGSGIHLAVGGLMDLAGNDSYVMSSGLGQGGSHDFAASVMVDRGGQDRYMGSTSCNGSGLTNSVGLFFDRAGADIYGADPDAFSLGGGRWGRDTGSVGVFVDTGGKDHYLGRGMDDTLWTQHRFGAGVDINSVPPPADSPVEPAHREQAVEIPEICSYEGELTDEVFQELWEIAIRWTVGDNRVIVPRARQRLVDFGGDVLPYLDRELHDDAGLTLRAFQELLEGLSVRHGEAVQAMLEENLHSQDQARQKNALRLSGHLKLAAMGPAVATLLEHEELRLDAIRTLGEMASPAGNRSLRALLSKDQDQRVILTAASTLLGLGVQGLYPELRSLLTHRYFTVRRGIAAMMVQLGDDFVSDAATDLGDPGLDKTTRIGLLDAVARYNDRPPSAALYAGVNAGLNSESWVVRAFALRVLQNWLTCEGQGWESLRQRIRARLAEFEATETNSYLRRLLAAHANSP
jgi:hypothetical protein